ncbi:hypothetical protein FB567DRAFT_531132 [Paraphoma chrysanthemicola]|uniref:Uncharacterized protein n=1 Tax=Paraphoma chrysanthemicola TaxID=798071 RepID=A0A8K0R1R2_9PLEO|nr:hypothetical protein FB567DRAFT_531132 [Paraphoma chrysanthemicola]
MRDIFLPITNKPSTTHTLAIVTSLMLSGGYACQLEAMLTLKISREAGRGWILSPCQAPCLNGARSQGLPNWC